MSHSSGRWRRGSHWPKSSRNENTRSFARARSSSRRAPPNAASKPCASIASSSVVVCSRLREARGPVSSTTRPVSIDSCTEATIASGTRRSRNSITSGKLCPVSTCMTGNGSGAGRERLLGQRQQQDRVLAAGEQQHRLLQLGRHLADDVDGLRLELLEVGAQRYTAHSPSPRMTWNGTFLLPVHEVLHRLEPELDRHREVADLVLEGAGPDAVGEGVEDLALVVPLGLVEADPALDGLGHALGGQPDLQPLAVDDLAALVVAADVGDVGGDRLLADLDRGAVEPDVADVVLAAAVGAAGHLDVDLLRERVLDAHRLDALAHRVVEPHRARDAELAGVGAGAGDDVVDLVGAGVGEVQLLEALPDVVDRLVAHPAQQEVLVHGGAGVAAGEVAHDVGEPAELLGREVAADDLDLHGREAVLALLLDVGRAGSG